jgi:hypothetical protein
MGGFAIQLSLLRQKQTGSRLDLSPCRSGASVAIEPYVAAEEAHPR